MSPAIRFRRLILAAGCALVLAACPESWRLAEKSPGSALWLGSRSQPLPASDLARLDEAGIREVYMTVARLAPSEPGGPLVPLEVPAPPRSMPVTLAISGEWTGAEDAGSLSARVAGAVRELRFDIESRGGVPAGLHFDLRSVESFESYAAFLAALRTEFDGSLFVSTTLRRPWLDRPAVEEVCRAVDFVVPFLYGQRVDEAEDGRAWDYIEVEQQLQRLEELEVPYLIGIIGLGTATHLNADGNVKARTTLLSLQEIVWNRDLRLRPGFSLEGVNRRVYAVVADRPTRVGKWRLTAGDGVRVVRAATSDVEELTRLVDVWQIPHHLGQVYYRLPSPEEHLSLTLENLLNALDPTPASPQLELDVSLQRRTGRGWLVRLSVRNGNGEITELSLLDSNYVQARALGGEFSSRVKVGDFYRYELYRTDRDGEPVRDIRSPDLLRLHLPILEGRQQLTSGDVEVKVDGPPVLEVEGRFLLPDGRTITVGPRTWRDGEFEDEVEAESGDELGTATVE